MDEILLIDKPAGMTSFGVVARVRRHLSDLATAKYNAQNPHDQIKRKKVKVGHTGTLDPFATGLLILLTGTATKRAPEFLKLDKVYEATLHLSATSTTGDPEGKITALVSCAPSIKQINQVLASFLGPSLQTPPAFSALKIHGRRAYDLARQGRPVDLPPRPIEIYSIELLSYNYPELKIRTHVSSGTYIRSLAADIGAKLGTGAYLTALRRTKIGQYDIKNAQKLSDFMKNS